MNNKLNFIQTGRELDVTAVERMFGIPLIMLTKGDLCKMVQTQYETINTLLEELRKVAPEHELFD